MYEELFTKVAVCCITYKDRPGIERLIKSADKFTIIFVDGRFKDWENSELSDDGSKELVQNTKHIWIEAPNLIEHQKRNIYITQAQKMGFEYCLVIDSDEYIEYLDPKLVLRDLKRGDLAYSIVQNYDATHHIPYYRFHTTKARHENRHQELYLDGTQLWNGKQRILSGLIIKHDKILRDSERERYRLQYYKANPVR